MGKHEAGPYAAHGSMRPIGAGGKGKMYEHEHAKSTEGKSLIGKASGNGDHRKGK